MTAAEFGHWVGVVGGGLIILACVWGMVFVTYTRNR